MKKAVFAKRAASELLLHFKVQFQTLPLNYWLSYSLLLTASCCNVY